MTRKRPARLAKPVRIAAVAARSRGFLRLYVMGVLLAYCGVFYYFGEIVDLFGWDALRWEFFYSVHDVHRLLFLGPVLFSAYCFGVRATVIVALISAAVMLPRAIFVSPYPDPFVRMLLTAMAIGTLGYLTAANRREARQRGDLETALRSERDKLRGILERIQDGVVIIGPDYRIRYMNPAMALSFGQGVGGYCYSSLYKRDTPCQRSCPLRSAIRGGAQKWRYVFPDGRIYEVVASSYRDADGVLCALATYRDASGLVTWIPAETEADLSEAGRSPS